jgi:hypothetical protein
MTLAGDLVAISGYLDDYALLAAYKALSPDDYF